MQMMIDKLIECVRKVQFEMHVNIYKMMHYEKASNDASRMTYKMPFLHRTQAHGKKG